MSKILFTVWPYAGHLNPTMAVAHALRTRGHEVAFYSGNRARAAVEGAGFMLFPFGKLDEEHSYEAMLRAGDSTYWSFWEKLRNARAFKSAFSEWLIATVPDQVEDLEQVLAKWHPDVIVCETAMWGPIIVLSQIRDTPVAVFSTTAACILPGPDAPAWGQGLPRPRNGLMRLRSTVARKLVEWFSTDFRTGVNAVRQQYGLHPLRRTVTEFSGQMPLYIVPTTPEFDYERTDLPPSVHYVGPCLWDNAEDEPAPEWLLELTGDQPVIHVTEATIHEQEPLLLRTAVRAFEGLSAQVVMTTGRHRNPAELDLGPLASNIRVERYVPHSQLLPLTSVLVTMGGAGTVLAALKASVPLVIVPTEWDKPENAQRVVEAGAGLRIAPKRCTPQTLRAAVERVLREPSFRQNAHRLAKMFAGYDGPARSAELLEQLPLSTRAKSVEADAHESQRRNKEGTSAM